MDYATLLKDLTFAELESMAETWYSRLKILQEVERKYNSKKAKRLSFEMMRRLFVIQPVYIQVLIKISTPKPKFHRGSL